jgi:cell shape-determining protein MreC
MFPNTKTNESQDKFKKLADDFQEIVDDLFLNIKYLMFDLEATRRENMELKQRLLDQEKGLNRETLSL